MKLVIVHDEGTFYFADEVTGEKVTNVGLSSCTYAQPFRQLTSLGSPHGHLNYGTGTISFSGELTSGSSIVSKRKVYVIALNQRDFGNYVLKEIKSKTDKEAHKYVELIPVINADDLRGSNVTDYAITPSAIHNPEFTKIIEKIKSSRVFAPKADDK